MFYSGRDFDTSRNALVEWNVPFQFWDRIAYLTKPADQEKIKSVIQKFCINQFSSISILNSKGEGSGPIPLIDDVEYSRLGEEILGMSKELQTTLDQFSQSLGEWEVDDAKEKDYEIITHILNEIDLFIDSMDFTQADSYASLAVKVHAYKNSLAAILQNMETVLEELNGLKESESLGVKEGIGEKIEGISKFNRKLRDDFTRINYYLQLLERFENENNTARKNNEASILAPMTYNSFSEAIEGYMKHHIPGGGVAFKFADSCTREGDFKRYFNGRCFPRGLYPAIEIYLQNAVFQCMKLKGQRNDLFIQLKVAFILETKSFELTVTDNAGGVSDPSVIPVLFEGHSMGKGVFGTGIGLPQAKRIAKTLHGSVSARNIGEGHDAGAEFKFTFPLKWAKADEGVPEKKEGEAQSA